MSDWVMIAFGLLAVGLIGFALEQAPAVIHAIADARIVRELRFTRGDVAVAIAAGIDRSAPDVGPDLRDRLASTVIEDLELGRLDAYRRELEERR